MEIPNIVELFDDSAKELRKRGLLIPWENEERVILKEMVEEF